MVFKDSVPNPLSPIGELIAPHFRRLDYMIARVTFRFRHSCDMTTILTMLLVVVRVGRPSFNRNASDYLGRRNTVRIYTAGQESSTLTLWGFIDQKIPSKDAQFFTFVQAQSIKREPH